MSKALIKLLALIEESKPIDERYHKAKAKFRENKELSFSRH
jgi:hypothetical protein